MAETNKCAKHQRSEINMVKYCGKNGKIDLKIRIKCVKCQRLYSVIGQLNREKDKEGVQMK